MFITIKGRIPSKKNSRITNTKTGRSFPSKKYTEWHKGATVQLLEQGAPKNKVKFIEQIHLIFYAPDMRPADLTNKSESIMDLLKDYGLMEDDNWFVCPDIHISFGGVDRENPRCEIVIPEYPFKGLFFIK